MQLSTDGADYWSRAPARLAEQRGLCSAAVRVVCASSRALCRASLRYAPWRKRASKQQQPRKGGARRVGLQAEDEPKYLPMAEWMQRMELEYAREMQQAGRWVAPVPDEDPD